jgi:glycosyltransferase involved in cell wall biosynthesis
MPLVSVVMPVYNGEKYINEAIDSILQQTFNDIEFIIINDGSTDNSLEIIKSYNDERIIIINQENQGIAVSLNNGIKISQGKYIARMDADDISHNTRIKTQADFLNDNPDVIVVGSNADVIDQDSKFVYRAKQSLDNKGLKKKLPFKTPFIHPSVMMRKKTLTNIGLYPDIPIAQDIFLFNRLSNLGDYANIKKPLIKYRLTPSASTRRSAETQNALVSILKEYLNNNKINKNQIKLLKKSIGKFSKNDKYFQYHILLAKKYLWNNYQPKLARVHIKHGFQHKTVSAFLIGLFVLSFLPEKSIVLIYKFFKK